MASAKIVPAVAVAAPVGDAIDRMFAGPTLLVKQTKKGCIQELMGCEDTSEFWIATKENKEANIMHALEDSSCCCRLFWASNRPLKVAVREHNKEGPVVVNMDLPFHCFNCCCFIPTMMVSDAAGVALGKTTQPWICTCVPELRVFDSGDQHKYNVHLPKCLGGCCIDCNHKVDGQGGCCSCKIPFQIMDLEGKEVGYIMKEWRGLGTEALTDASTFGINFPQGIDSRMKSNLLGTTMLLNYFMFESSNDD